MTCYVVNMYIFISYCSDWPNEETEQTEPTIQPTNTEETEEYVTYSVCIKVVPILLFPYTLMPLYLK